jgi:hypothetical protein
MLYRKPGNRDALNEGADLDTLPVSTPIPVTRNRRLRLQIPPLQRVHQFAVMRFGRKRGSLVLCLAFLALVLSTFALAKRFATRTKKWPMMSPAEAPTLVFRREDLQRIWKWEIASGHYQSYRSSMSFSQPVFERNQFLILDHSSQTNWPHLVANESGTTPDEISHYSPAVEATSWIR